MRPMLAAAKEWQRGGGKPTAEGFSIRSKATGRRPGCRADRSWGTVHPYALPASHASSVDAGRGRGLVPQLPFAPQVPSRLGDGRQGIAGRHFGIAAAQGFASPLNHFTAY